MTYHLDTDNDAFLQDFGVSVTGAASFTAIYDSEYIDVGDITGYMPVLTAPNTDAIAALEADDNLIVTTDGVNKTSEAKVFRLIRAEPDGTGWTKLILRALT